MFLHAIFELFHVHLVSILTLWDEEIINFKQKDKDMKNFKFLAVLSVLLLTAASLTACNTMAGAGQDIEEGGEAVQRAAN